MAKNENSGRPRRDRVIVGVSIALMVLAALAIAVILLWNSRLFGGNNGAVVNMGHIADKQKEAGSEDGLDSSAPTDAKAENFLLCGLDESEQLTDIIMVMSVNFSTNEVNILQIPRDTYVASGAAGTGKINSAYSGGDSSLTPINRLIKVINEQFQLRIDHYGTVTIESFRNIIDAMGGVPIDMPYAIGNNQYGIIPAGPQILDGEHAEWLVRHRKTYVDQDIGRIKIQRLFLAACVEQAKKMGIKELTQMIPAVYGNVTTDLTVGEMVDYAKWAITVDMDKIHIYMVPGEGVTYRGQSLWTAHLYETADLLNEHFRAGMEPVPAEELKITELAHTNSYYEDTDDDFGDLLDGETPGKKKENESSTVYSHVVTQPPVTKKKPQTTWATQTTTPAESPAQGQDTTPAGSYIVSGSDVLPVSSQTDSSAPAVPSDTFQGESAPPQPVVSESGSQTVQTQPASQVTGASQPGSATPPPQTFSDPASDSTELTLVVPPA